MLPASLGGDKITFTADFANVAGMYEGNEVAILGLPVGTIDKIEPMGRLVRVEMTVDGDVKIPADVKAAEVSPSVVTNRHIELVPAYSGEGPTLADGDHIPLERTRTPVSLDRVLKSLDRITADLQGTGPEGAPGPLSGRILYNALNGNGDKLRDTIQSLSTALQIGIDNRDAVTDSIVKLNELTTIVAENDQSLREFSSNVTNLTGILADQAPGLNAVLDQLDAFLRNTSTVLAENQDQLTGSLVRLGSTAELLRENARNLTELIDVGPLLFQNINNAISYDTHQIRVHALLDRSILDGELVSLFCERIQMKADGCRTGKMIDFGPDFGLTEAMLGITK